MFTNTFWCLVPAILAIALALITKEVYSSLFIGILFGGALYANFSFTGTLEHVFIDGMIGSLTDSWNVGIIIFLVVLGAMVMLMNRAGGSAAFGRWAGKHVKTKVGAQLATIALGVLIFIDDYFNCLTVGSVMSPLAEQQGISRAKLAYLIDATAAPVCVIAPISSWAAAVAGMVEGANGFTVFVRAIPYNFYAILTITMMLTLAMGKFDYGPMKIAEMTRKLEIHENTAHAAVTGAEDLPTPPVSSKGKVIHLVLPIIVLIVCCVLGLTYTGGLFDGAGFIDSFADSDASVGLVYGSVVALIITIVFYLVTRVLTFNECMNALPEGFKAMVPPIFVLTFAWTLKAMTDSLGSTDYVTGIVESFSSNSAIMSLLPAFLFLVACGIAFATGTSWGTFGIMIPIASAAFNADMGSELMIISISACMAGGVFGDHCSPISDSTIMASAGAQCDHIQHVSTQLPYALTAGCTALVCYIFAGFIRNWVICLPLSILLMIGVLLAIRNIEANKNPATE
ncbi:MAG: Na+/H+ antiporter NhaC family protein [Ruminococcaceae bacterium]|nr:Na+/H+ antiporter NhaC family protein [Oscillospiraceae bacterium]